MEVKLVARTLDLFELFGQERRPLSLTELSRGLEVPMSSTLAMVRTLAAKGYLHEVRRKGGYYPTRKMLDLCGAIDTHDPLLELVHPLLVALRDACGETVVLGRRVDAQVLYLDTVPADQAIRYTAQVGDLRPLQANSIGKALFAMLEPAEQKALLPQLDWKKRTARTLVTRDALLTEAAQIRARGWASNVGESVPDLAALAMPFDSPPHWYAVSIVGPIARMEAQWKAHVRQLTDTVERIRQTLAGTPL